MKKVKILGKAIPVFVLVLLGIGMVSGALVTYLSNTAEVSVTVESPVLLEVSTEGSTWSSNPATLSFGSVYGGEPIHFWIRDTNLASVAIVGSSTKLVTCDTGVTCDDFKSVMAGTTDLLTLPNGCVQYIDPIALVEDPNIVDFSEYSAGGLAANSATTTEITMAFKQNALGTYVFTMQKMV